MSNGVIAVPRPTRTSAGLAGRAWPVGPTPRQARTHPRAVRVRARPPGASADVMRPGDASRQRAAGLGAARRSACRRVDTGCLIGPPAPAACRLVEHDADGHRGGDRDQDVELERQRVGRHRGGARHHHRKPRRAGCRAASRSAPAAPSCRRTPGPRPTGSARTARCRPSTAPATRARSRPPRPTRKPPAPARTAARGSAARTRT